MCSWWRKTPGIREMRSFSSLVLFSPRLWSNKLGLFWPILGMQSLDIWRLKASSADGSGFQDGRNEGISSTLLMSSWMWGRHLDKNWFMNLSISLGGANWDHFKGKSSDESAGEMAWVKACKKSNIWKNGKRHYEIIFSWAEMCQRWLTRTWMSYNNVKHLLSGTRWWKIFRQSLPSNNTSPSRNCCLLTWFLSCLSIGRDVLGKLSA